MTDVLPDTPNALIERIYEIAAEPAQLDAVIADWLQEGPASLDDRLLGNHLDRAKAFLARLEPAALDYAAVLRQYSRFAAFILSDTNVVVQANAGAQSAFGISEGHPLHAAILPDGILDRLKSILREARAASDQKQLLLRMDFQRQKGSVLLRVQRLQQSNAVLIVSTHFQWSARSDTLLKEAYNLTTAERDVVRLLVEGRDTKAISAERGTSEGTTRGQIKSIIAKMNLRSQVDIVRIAVMLGEMPGLQEEALAKPVVRKNWLEQEVWKPLSNATLPDGRNQSFFEMGPPDGNPILLSHLGSCMVRWTTPMLRLAFSRNLRVICPIRAGYGQSDLPPGPYDPFALTTQDTLALLDRLNITALPYVVQGSDFPLAAHFVATQGARVTEVLSVGGRPCLPDGSQIEGPGAWQRFFLVAAKKAPKVTEFAASATMAMSRRVGPKAMLRSLCKDSPDDLALLKDPDVSAVLESNIALMSDRNSSAARAFANEYIAFQTDWSSLMQNARQTPMRAFVADQDPTFDLTHLPQLQAAYPEIPFEVMKNAGLALIYQHYDRLLPLMAEAARKAS